MRVVSWLPAILAPAIWVGCGSETTPKPTSPYGTETSDEARTGYATAPEDEWDAAEELESTAPEAAGEEEAGADPDEEAALPIPRPAPALTGEAWIGEKVDPSAQAASVRLIAFFKPG